MPPHHPATRKGPYPGGRHVFDHGICPDRRVHDEPAVTGEAAETAVHTETGVPNEGEHGGAFPPFDPTHFPSQLLWLAITFGIFFLLISRVISPRIGGILKAAKTASPPTSPRPTRPRRSRCRCRGLRKELAAARAKAGSIATEARDSAKAKADAERAKLEASLTEKLAAAEANIAAIKDKALSEVGAIATETAQVVVEQLTGTKVSKADAGAAVKAVSK